MKFKTIEDLYKVYNRTKIFHPFQRPGQYIFNICHLNNPKKANKIRATNNDCFYDNEKIDLFLQEFFNRSLNVAIFHSVNKYGIEYRIGYCDNDDLYTLDDNHLYIRDDEEIRYIFGRSKKYKDYNKAHFEASILLYDLKYNKKIKIKDTIVDIDTWKNIKFP